MLLAPVKKKLSQLLIRFAKFSLEQMGYRCKSKYFTLSKNKGAWALLCTGIGAFIISLLTANDIGFISILGNLVASVLMFIPLYLSHKDAIRIHRKNNVQITSDHVDRTPHGSQLVIYSVLYAYSFLAFIYRCFAGEFALWLVNYAVYFAECTSIVVDVLVVFFDAELIIE